MWKTKTWKLSQKEAYLKWLDRHMHSCQITVLFVNNGYGVSYRKLRIIE